MSDGAVFDEILDSLLSRRRLLQGGVASLALTFLEGSPLAPCPASAARGETRAALLAFQGIATSDQDVLTIPSGYRDAGQVFARLRDRRLQHLRTGA
jgi:secreted PhoX family phosphatase